MTDAYFAAGEIGYECSVMVVAELLAARHAGLQVGFGTQQCWLQDAAGEVWAQAWRQ